MLGITLALLSAAVSGFAVVAVGKHSGKSNAFNVSLVVSLVGVPILWPLAVGLTDFSAVNFEGMVLFALCGVLTPGLVRLFYYSGLKKLGTSVNSAVFAVYPLYSSLLAVLFLSETLTIKNLTGVFSIILGLVFVEIVSSNLNGGNNKSAKNLILPMLGGLVFGASTVIRKEALNLCNTPVMGVAIAYTFSLLPFAIAVAVHMPTRKELSLKQNLGLFWVAGVGQALSWILSFYALSLQSVAVIAPLLSIEPIFVVLLAYLYLKELEHVSPKLIASILLTVLGVILVTT